MSISKLVLAFSLMMGALSLCLAPLSHAADGAKKSAKHKAAPVKAADPETDEPDTKGSDSTDFKCELGNHVTVYTDPTDDAYIALRWNKRVHRMVRVGTSTGARRFENGHYGLVWIGIPAKSMLLDSKLGRQLANECKSVEQVQAEMTVVAPKQQS
ncbi:MAG: hypothetical protein ACI83P_000090 [Janthinobacterium sp.]|jgi:hypothetical protein